MSDVKQKIHSLYRSIETDAEFTRRLRAADHAPPPLSRDDLDTWAWAAAGMQRKLVDREA